MYFIQSNIKDNNYVPVKGVLSRFGFAKTLKGAMDIALTYEKFHETDIVITQRNAKNEVVEHITLHDGIFTDQRGFTSEPKLSDKRFRNIVKQWRAKLNDQIRKFHKDKLNSTRPKFLDQIEDHDWKYSNLPSLDYLITQIPGDPLPLPSANRDLNIFDRVCNNDIHWFRENQWYQRCRGKISLKYNYYYNNALELAAIMGRDEIVKLLFDRFDATSRSIAVAFLAERGNLEMVKWCYRKGVILPVTVTFNETDVHNVYGWLKRNGHQDIIDFCIQNSRYSEEACRNMSPYLTHVQKEITEKKALNF